MAYPVKIRKYGTGKLLTIVIPTRDRPVEAYKQLKHLLFLSGNINDIEILLSDNGIQEFIDVEELLPFQENREYKYLRHKRYYETTEEHLFALLPMIDSYYVWFLSDDDVVVEHTFFELLKTLKTKTYDLLIWNSGITDFKCEKVLIDKMPGLSSYSDTSLEVIAAQTGYWTSMASISVQVYRPSKVLMKEFSKVISSLGPIYSHVTMLFPSFKNSRCGYFNSSLIHYRLNEVADYGKKWLQYTNLKKIPPRDPWVVSFLKQIEYLVTNGYVGKDFLIKCWHRYYNPMLNKIQIAPLAAEIRIQILHMLKDYFQEKSSFRYSRKTLIWLLSAESNAELVLPLREWLTLAIDTPDYSKQIISSRLGFEIGSLSFLQHLVDQFYEGSFFGWALYHSKRGYIGLRNIDSGEILQGLSGLGLSKDQNFLVTETRKHRTIQILSQKPSHHKSTVQWNAIESKDTMNQLYLLLLYVYRRLPRPIKFLTQKLFGFVLKKLIR
jgi:hypothetical protein